ncbi:SET domain-containing protein [Daldinia sp. FL1419]|nr:SET domain-containing protein [Daldinia sp. FL1419]
MVETHQLASGGEAVYATVNIPRGTRIVAEVPLIVVPPFKSESEEIWALCKAVDGLADDQVDEFARIPCNPELLKAYKEKGFVEEIAWSFYKSKKLKDKNGSLLKGKRMRKIVNKTIRICLVYVYSNVQLGPEGKHGSGIFSLYSRMRHSCIPNAYNCWNATLGRLTIHAIHDIKAGEQIFVNYIGNVCRVRKQRALSLYHVWRITCNCVACTDDALDQTRYRMLVLDQALAAWDQAGDRGVGTLGADAFDSAEEALQGAEELLSLLKKERLCGMELCRAVRDCSERAFGCCNFDKALKYAQMELKYEIALIGTDNDHHQQDYYGAKRWIERMEERVKLFISLGY